MLRLQAFQLFHQRARAGVLQEHEGAPLEGILARHRLEVVAVDE